MSPAVSTARARAAATISASARTGTVRCTARDRSGPADLVRMAEWPRELLESAALRGDAQPECGERSDEHQARTERIAREQLVPAARLDQRAEQRRREE